MIGVCRQLAQRLSEKSTGLAVAALMGITLVFYHGLWLPGLVLIKRDAYRFYPPLWVYVIERLSTGELPQWISYDGLGRPFIGTSGGTLGVFHPYTALFFLLTVHDAYRLLTLLACLLAAIGAFFLGRILNFSRTGALVSGLAFSLSGYVVSLTDSAPWLYSICLLPLFCATLEKALRGLRTWVVPPAVVWATVFLIGDIQTGYYYSFIALAWTAARAPHPRLEAYFRLVLVGGLAVLMAGVQLGPAWAVFIGSDRAQPELFHAQALSWSTHPLRLPSVLASPIAENESLFLLGRLLYGPPRAGVWAESLYIGIPITGLAILAIRHRPDLRVLGLLGATALLLALGRAGVLYEVFYHTVPLWSAFRYPEKLMGVVSFVAAMLAGAGVDALRAGKGQHIAWLAGAALCGCTGLWLDTDMASRWMAKNFNLPEALVHDVTAAGVRAFFFSAIAALGMWLLVLGMKKGLLREALVLVALVAMITFDLSRANWAVLKVGPKEASTFTPSLVEAIRVREGALVPGRFRLITFNEDDVVCPEHVRRWLGFYGCWSVERRQALDMEHQTQFHIETVRSLLPGLNPAFLAMFNHGVGVEGAARFNVSYYIGRRYRFTNPMFAQSLVAELNDYALTLVKNPASVKPRVYLSRQPERAITPVDSVQLLARHDFLKGDVDVIETVDTSLPGPAINGTATIERYAPENVQVRVETPTPAVLVLLDAFDAGWRAALENGSELLILRANALVRAVVLPPGCHVVTFSYETPLLRLGAAASLIGAMIGLAMITQARWRMRRPEAVPP